MQGDIKNHHRWCFQDKVHDAEVHKVVMGDDYGS